MNCSMRGMPRVSTLSTWVSPRWKRPEPCAVGRMLDLGRQRTDVGGAAAVDAQALVDDPAADDLLLQRAERGLDLLGAGGERLGLVGRAAQREQQALEDLVEAVVALGLVGDRHRLRRVDSVACSATVSNTSSS